MDGVNQKFRHLKTEHELEITAEQIQIELNEKLENALILSDD